MQINYTAFSEIGLEMRENQDGLFCGVENDVGIFIVADGMGGHQDGARASRAIIEETAKWWNQYLRMESRPGFFSAIEELKEHFSYANQEIYQNTKKGEVCGSTLVALWLDHNAWAVFSCGDSRCYQGKGKGLRKRFRQLTTDDVWENQPQNICGMSRQQIAANKNHGCLVRAVGVKPGFQCSIQSDQCKETMLFLLCSDGIYKYCPEEVLKKKSFAAMKSKDLDHAAEDIQKQVMQNGAGDNLTLALVMAEA